MSNVPYKRVKYEKQNGFDIPYYDNNALPFPSICSTCERYEVINGSRVNVLEIEYTRCSDGVVITNEIPPDTYLYVCSCDTPEVIFGASFTITNIGICP
jgi:hypothetical protein